MKKESAAAVSADDGNRNDSRGSAAAPVQPMALDVKADMYAEWDTEETILAVKNALEAFHAVTMIEADNDAYVRLRESRPDIVFNIAEGLLGPSREAQMPAIFEMLGLPYTGSDPLTLALCLDKARTKEILSYHRIPNAAFAVVHSSDQCSSLHIDTPCIVKPLHEGSSKGVLDRCVVRSRDELRGTVEEIITEYRQPALVEKFLPGREFTVGIIGNGPTARVLPIVEIRFDTLPEGVNPIYSYEAKWIWDTVEQPIDVHECPAKLDPVLERQIQQTALRTFTTMQCRDWCRIDIRLDEENVPNIIELNPLPGILPDPEAHSCLPLAARTGGLDYVQMINAVLNAAIARYGLV